MKRATRGLGALLATAALLLGGCDVVDSDAGTEDGQRQQGSESTGSEPDAADGPGDLLPSQPATPEPTTAGSTTPGPAAPEPSTPDPSDDQGEPPELGSPGIPACDVLDLPATTLDTIEDIEAGGPYEFPRNDGVTFQNREAILPDESHDYYREFTVITPGLDHRGARRIVTGGGAEVDPDHWYYTGDHYESFCEFDPELAG